MNLLRLALCSVFLANLSCHGEEPGLVELLLNEHAPQRDWVKHLRERIERDAPFPEWSSIPTPGDEKPPPTPSRAELIKQAAVVEIANASPQASKAFEKLEKMDQQAAEKILLTLTNDPSNPMSRVFALGKLIEHYHEDDSKNDLVFKWREQVKVITRDPDLPPQVRLHGIRILFLGKWPEQEAWFTDLFRHEVFFEPFDKYPYHVTIENEIARQPDRWIPHTVKLINHENRKIHNRAVSCLAQFHIMDARADALRPLLPWLSDPKWATTPNDLLRLRLIQSLDHVDLPESVPGLIWAVEHGEDSVVSYGAQSLLHYQARQAIPVLKTALKKLTGKYYQRDVIRVVHKLGGYRDNEILTALKAFAENTSEKNHSLQVKIGEAIYDLQEFDSKMIDQILELAATTNPRAGNILRKMAAGVLCESSDREFARRLKVGDLEFSWLATILDHQKHYGAVAAEIENLTGHSLGVQAAFSESSELAKKILTSKDRAAKTMLLACSRLLRFKLPIHQVTPLTEESEPKELRRAAMSYLEDIDTEKSRAFLNSQKPDPARSPFRRFGWWGDVLKEDFDNGSEIFVLLSSGGWGDLGQRFISISDDKATFVHDEGNGRYRQRDIPASEIAEFRDFVKKFEIDDLPPYTPAIDDGIQFNYLHLTHDGPREVFMNNPPIRNNRFPRVGAFPGKEQPPADIYGILVEKIFHLGTAGPSQVHYHSAQSIPGFEVLHEREEGEILHLSGEDGILKVEVAMESPSGEESTVVWKSWNDGELSAKAVKKTAHFPVDRDRILENDDFFAWDHLLRQPWKARLGKSFVHPAQRERDDQRGLWRFQEDREPGLLAPGTFANIVITPDEKWIVAARTDEGSSWAPPNSVYRIEVATGEVFRVELPAADNFNAVSFVEAHDKVLLNRQGEHYLLNAATGKSERIEGKFSPLHSETWRPLQATGIEHESWACLPTGTWQDLKMQIGKYNSKTFKFTLRQTVPGLYFESLSMWIDESQNKVYLVHEGDLIRFSLK